MGTYRVIVVGVGMWGMKWIEEIRVHHRLRLAGIVAKTEESVGLVSERYCIDAGVAFTEVGKAMKASPAEIAVVVSPPACHLEHVDAAMSAGKHVICEKPLADTWDGALKIAEVVRSHPNLKFMVSQTRRFTDQVHTLRQTIASGRIGKPDTITFDHRVNYTGGGYRQEMDFPVLEDMICHHLDALRYITGQEATSVYSEGWNPAWSQFSGKGSNNVLACMTGRIHVNYFGSWTSRGQLNSYDGVLKVMGDQGSLDLVDNGTLNYYPFTGSETGPTPPPQSVPMLALDHREIGGVIDAFLRALDRDERPLCGIDDNLRTFAFNWAVLQSCRLARRVELCDGLMPEGST